MSNFNSTFSVSYKYTNDLSSDANISNIEQLKDRTYRASYQNGTGPNQADSGYSDHQVVTGGGTFNYVLSALPNGESLSKVRKLVVEVISPVGTIGSLIVGPTGTNGWTNGLPANSSAIGPGGFFAFVQPDDVPATDPASGSNDSVTVIVTGILEFMFVVEGVH